MHLKRSTTRWWPAALLVLVVTACSVGEPTARDPVPRGEPADTLVVERPDPGADPAADRDEAAAGELLTRARLAYEAAELGEALDLARRVLREYPATSAVDGARWLAARAAFSLERYAEARELAEAHAAAVSGTSAAEEARALAELARDALEPPESAPVVLGAVLPRTGPRAMMRYSEWLLQGIQLAVQEAERREGRPIELIVEDDAGGTRTRQAVAELERRGAFAIVGPMLPQQVADAAGARVNEALVTVTPTAPDHPSSPQVYSVNAPDTRGAQELARYAMEVGLGQAALLYPRQPDYERKASAFAVEYEALGGEIRVVVPYDSGTTTFETHMRRIVEAVAPAAGGDTAAYPGGWGDPVREPRRQPFVLFVAAPERDVRQIAPQVTFYGLDAAGVQVLGDEAWASATVRRVIPAQDLEGVIAASPFPPSRAEATADPQFIDRYEQMFRRSLENQLPALGYDAAHLVLQALPNRSVTPGRVARRFGLLTGIRGASGTFSVRADRIVRTPFLVVIRNGSLASAPPASEYRPPVPASSGSAGGGRE